MTVKYGYRPKDLRKIGFSWEPIKKRSSGCENHQQSKDSVKLKSPLSNLRGNKKKISKYMLNAPDLSEIYKEKKRKKMISCDDKRKEVKKLIF